MTQARDKANIPVLNFASKGIDDNADATAITIDSSERVGIGKTSPASLLDIEGTSVVATFKSTNNNTVLRLKGSNATNGGALGSTSSGDLTFLQNLSEGMRLTSTGLGIGTSSPSCALNVNGGSVNGNVFKTTTSGDNNYLAIDNTSTGGQEWVLNSSGNGSGNGGGAFAIQGPDSNTPRLLINSSGSVGIGDSAPQGKLHVKTSDSGVSSSPSHSNELVLENSTNGGITFNCGASNSATMTFQNSSNADDGSITYRNSEREFRFKTAGADRMRFHSNGVISSTGGIALGVGTANTASNVLDDYEEGTWTPVVNTASGFSTGATNYSGTNAPRYTKIGDRVFLQAQVQMGNSSGNVALDDSITMTGLPFTPSDIERNTVTEYRFNNNVAYMTSILLASGAVQSIVRFIKGTSQRNGGAINININYRV